MFNDLKFNHLQTKKLTGTTVLGEYNGQKIAVSQMLTTIENILMYIKNNFDINEKPYSVAIIVLKTTHLRFNNQNIGKSTKEQWKCLVDVVHEIEDLKATTDVIKRENEKIANDLKMVIELFYRGDDVRVQRG
ncbi:MAG: hypothetical protein NC084_13550 [Bacteroides sp.]|nr:hypothetical protein [Eubacterium sp.]MCM1419741.1 hypothetical protein [Roseburia sp.]MCM1463721.1 hypothetical protein [Bacteroides sp.]